MQYYAQIGSMEIADTIKVYALNTGAFMASCCDWMEPTLKIFAALIIFITFRFICILCCYLILYSVFV